jgi:hypothetical protein
MVSINAAEHLLSARAVRLLTRGRISTLVNGFPNPTLSTVKVRQQEEILEKQERNGEADEP